jgi:hypothetical protein
VLALSLANGMGADLGRRGEDEAVARGNNHVAARTE